MEQTYGILPVRVKNKVCKGEIIMNLEKVCNDIILYLTGEKDRALERPGVYEIVFCLITQVIEGEREQCAKIAEDEYKRNKGNHDIIVGEEIAKTIRNQI